MKISEKKLDIALAKNVCHLQTYEVTFPHARFTE